MPDLILKIKKTIRKWKMLSKGDTVIAAVSGGADSVVMLHALLRLRREFSLDIVVAHMDHGLRGRESHRDFNFVKDISASLGLQFEGRSLPKDELKAGKGSTQEAAREKRYAFLDGAAEGRGANRVALGHTLNDQAETILMRLIKGASLTGLAGIPPVRGRYIRPLIESSREEIEEYAKQNGIKFVLDSSNLSTKYLRNKIRLGLIPFLEKGYNPNIIETAARTAFVLAKDEEFIEREALKAFRSVTAGKSEGSVRLDGLKLSRCHEAMISRVFLEAVRSIGIEADMISPHTEAFISLVKGKRPNASITLPAGAEARMEYGQVLLSRTALKEGPGFDMTLTIPGRTEIPGIGVIEAATVKRPGSFDGKKTLAYFDPVSIKKAGPLRVRQARPGDRMVPLGMKGHRKLKDIFIDEKVPVAGRKRTPVLAAGEDIVWVAGVRQSEHFKVTGPSKTALRLEFIPY